MSPKSSFSPRSPRWMLGLILLFGSNASCKFSQGLKALAAPGSPFAQPGLAAAPTAGIPLPPQAQTVTPTTASSSNPGLGLGAVPQTVPGKNPADSLCIQGNCDQAAQAAAGALIASGKASVYRVSEPGYQRGTQTASGIPLDDAKATCAMPVFKAGSGQLKGRFADVLSLKDWVTVENLSNGKRITIQVTDTGPFAVDPNTQRAMKPLQSHPTRHIDLSVAAMAQLTGATGGSVMNQLIEVRIYKAQAPGVVS